MKLKKESLITKIREEKNTETTRNNCKKISENKQKQMKNKFHERKIRERFTKAEKWKKSKTRKLDKKWMSRRGRSPLQQENGGKYYQMKKAMRDSLHGH